MAKDSYQEVCDPQGRKFSIQENRCRQLFEWAIDMFGGFWHLCTQGEGQAVIFCRKKDYGYMMTLIAVCAYAFPDIKIITFEVMSNHLHLLLCGPADEIMAFFAMLKKRLQRYLSLNGTPVGLDRFGCPGLIPVESLESVRNQIVYINRNDYIVDPDQTPFSYPYGGNAYYFNPFARRYHDGRLGDLPILKRRAFLHSRETDYPDSWLLVDGYVSPVNYLSLDIGEGLFRDARHYFHKISRDVESYREIAGQLGESLYYTDDELNSIVYRICRRDHGGLSPAMLPPDGKMELARTLHFDYNADNAKIARLLKMPRTVLDQMFHP